jgi:hypothetical protein
MLIFAQADLNDPPILTSHGHWDNRHVQLCPAIEQDGVMLTLPLQLVSNQDPPDLSLPSSYDCRHEPSAQL